jgi:hypothetical protein
MAFEIIKFAYLSVKCLFALQGEPALLKSDSLNYTKNIKYKNGWQDNY